MNKLGQKNLTYSMLLAAVMMLFLVGYFIWMLPSLYVSYVEEQNVEAVKKQHEAFMKNGTYDGVQVKNPAACISIKIPYEENYIEMASKMVSLKITASDLETAELMDELQLLMQSIDFMKNTDWKKESWKLSRLQENLEDIWLNRVQLPVSIEIRSSARSEDFFYQESFQMHEISKNRIIMESAVQDADNQYTNYLAAERTSDEMVFSLLPVITPQMGEIRPVVLQSLPMLCAVIFMLVLIFSQIYSGGIVRPACQKLQDINQKLQDMNQKLQDMNQKLQEENKRQEIFLRASAHQLKTPITAALLLLDGMINQIGKYKDTKTYLPKVKEQLLFMRTMTEEILSLNQRGDAASCCQICLYELVQARLAAYHVAASDKQLKITVDGDRNVWIWADGDILSKITDSLLSNAVAYTPPGKQISIHLAKQACVIRNEGVTISGDILPHIFEPFVRGSHGTQSHGLGLYIAAYYAKRMNAELTVQNIENGVEAVFKWHKN